MKNILSHFSVRNIYLFSLIFIAIGLLFSKIFVSTGQMVLAALWIFTGNYKNKLTSFYENKPLLISSSIFLVSLLGLFVFPQDTSYLLNDLRIKIPLLILPFLCSGFPKFSYKELQVILSFFILAVVLSTFWSIFVMLGGLGFKLQEARDISRFTSHVRFSILISLAIGFSIYYSLKAKNWKLRLLWISTILYLICFLFISGLITGIVLLVIACFLSYLFFDFQQKNPKIKVLIIGLLLLIPSYLIVLTYNLRPIFFPATSITLPKTAKTQLGNPYLEDTVSVRKDCKENGYYTFRHLSTKEMMAAWNKKNNLTTETNTVNQDILIRFLTSKGVKKDADAVEKLTPKEIAAIKNNVPNYQLLDMNFLEKRIYAVMWEIDNYISHRNFNGHSLIMRLEYLKTGYTIIKQNIWMGVGTGNVQKHFDQQYIKDNSILHPKYRLRAHNQYMTYFISSGVLGFLAFLFMLGFLLLFKKNHQNFLYWWFFILLSFSMISEDTLETQIGVTTFALFNIILLQGIGTERAKDGNIKKTLD